MKTTAADNRRKDDAVTRDRLLTAAAEVFARRGYPHATVREICARAGANVAAVNYHFGGKRKLYLAVFEHLLTEALTRHPALGDVPADASPAERLRGFVGALLRRVLSQDRTTLAFELMTREMSEPTDALDFVVRRMTRPLMLELRGIISQLLGKRAADATVRACVASVVGQCLFHRLAQPMIQRLFPDQTYHPDDIARLADHITNFSLAGIPATLRRPQASGGR